MNIEQIFTDMNYASAILLFVGLIFVVVEVLMPGFKYFIITGELCLLFGIVVRISLGLNWAQSLFLIMLVVCFSVMANFLIIINYKKGLWGSPRNEKNSNNE